MLNSSYHFKPLFILLFSLAGLFSFDKRYQTIYDRFVVYKINPANQNLQFFWKDDKGQTYKSIANLKSWLAQNHKDLLFAMNGGMYKEDNTPKGLFIQNQEVKTPPDTSSGPGNFYMKPNGVFYIATNNLPYITPTEQFKNHGHIKFATQSGPMVVINGNTHPAFKEGSANLKVRNGVGILPGNSIVFVTSKKEMNFYDFAGYFKIIGCKNALYLDGLISRTYLPEQKWFQTDSNFAVILAVIKKS